MTNKTDASKIREQKMGRRRTFKTNMVFKHDMFDITRPHCSTGFQNNANTVSHDHSPVKLAQLRICCAKASTSQR